MVKKFQTPGVYSVEKNAFPNSIVEVATAVPVFVGYTETCEAPQHNVLRNIPCRITSMADYRKYFGGSPKIEFSVTDKKPKDSLDDPVVCQSDIEYYLVRQGQPFFLYSCMLHFFQNGGGSCFVVSVGDYTGSINDKELIGGIEALCNEPDSTLLVVPDAVLLEEQACASVQVAALTHCRDTGSRFALLDVYRGYLSREVDPDCVTRFRNRIGTNATNYGAAYYPWVETTVVQDSEISFENIDDAGIKVLQDIVNFSLDSGDPNSRGILELSDKLAGNWTIDEQNDLEATKRLLHSNLFVLSSAYKTVMEGVQKRVNILPPSSAMAGIYTMVDNTRGVWKAPANVSLNGVIQPTVKISHDEQEDLNVNVQGKSINAIRQFAGEGTLVWGARTLDGNSLDWRYINVRRTLIMIEQSIKLASKAYVFEANDANTWVAMKSMVSNFLTGIWKRGGLAGATPEDAFCVYVGLGETLTPEDIQEGIVRISVLVAPTRPAEFIEITFEQKMQKS